MSCPRRSSKIILCYIPGTRWRTGNGGRRVDRIGLDGGRDRTVGFLILIKKGFFWEIVLILIQKQCLRH